MLILFESITGYSIFSCKEDLINSHIDTKFQNIINDYNIFSNNLNLKSFVPFRSINHALKECFKISRSLVSEYLEKFILNSLQFFESNIYLGVSESKLAINISKKIKKKNRDKRNYN